MGDEATQREGHLLVDQFVREAPPDQDEELIRYFRRHARREEMLMEGALGLGEGAALAPLRAESAEGGER